MVGVAMVAPEISPKRQEVLVENVHDRSPTRVADFEEAAARHQGDENHQMEKLVLGPLSEKPEIPTLKLTVQRDHLTVGSSPCLTGSSNILGTVPWASALGRGAGVDRAALSPSPATMPLSPST
jgi:hypothetical protein